VERTLSTIERLLLTLWVGGLWAVGFIVAPMLFKTLDSRQLAGTIAGELFSLMSYIGLVVGALLLVMALRGVGRGYLRSWRGGVLLLMLLLIVVGEFLLHPQITELRQSGLAVGGREASRFAALHGLSWGLYLLNATFGGVLVALGVTPAEQYLVKAAEG